MSTVLAVAMLVQAASAGVVQQRGYKARYLVFPPRKVDVRALQRQAATGLTVPFFTNSIVSPLDSNTYQFSIMGTDPTLAPATTWINYFPIALRIHFPDGTVLDSTQPGCGDTVSVMDRFFGSPLFKYSPQSSNGVNLGSVQLTDALQRAEFWSMVHGTQYHVRLASMRTPLVVDVNAPADATTGTGECPGTGHNLGMIDVNEYTTLLQNVIAQNVRTTGVLPVILAYNTVQTEGGSCCIIGYHSSYARNGGTEVFSTGAYTDIGEFGSSFGDITAWSHEIGEAFNDPFGNNATPAWGHIGQVPGCQANLEVGDPLTGTQYTDVYNGFTYHPQELVFFSWFFRTPSTGTGGLYSLKGTFTSTQGTCT